MNKWKEWVGLTKGLWVDVTNSACLSVQVNLSQIGADEVRSGQMRYGKDIWGLGERLSKR